MEYLSLYDYLGRAAGSELGYEVATIASEAKIEVRKRPAPSVSPYSKPINLYPLDFLQAVLTVQATINKQFIFKKP
jgi:hypothetical protein